MLVEHRPRANGTEDFVTFPSRPVRDEIRYRVELGGVFGLRKVKGSGTLELLDEGGTPRLRMESPYGVDADGRRFTVTARVERCDVDESPVPPWGRPVTPPGAQSCDVVLSWAAASPAYPLVVDPAWTTTVSMAVARAWHTAVVMADGRVLVAGGREPVTATAEVYDPATSTWATVGEMKTPRADHTATRLPDGRVIVVGGATAGPPWHPTRTASTEIYDPQTGTFSSGPTMTTPRSRHAMAVTSTGRLVAVGGRDPIGGEGSSWERTNSGFTGWTPANDIVANAGHSAAILSDDRVLVAGGDLGIAAEVLDLALGMATYPKPGGDARWDLALAIMNDGSVLLIGGSASTTVDRYTPSTDMLTTFAPLLEPREGHRVAARKDGKVVVIGGSNGSVSLATVEVLDPAMGAWSSVGALQTARERHTLSSLADGSLLIVGGETRTIAGTVVLSSAERCADGLCAKKPCSTTPECEPGEICAGGVCVAPSPPGFECASGAECQSGVCQQGVCCETTCAGACISCNAKDKQGSPSGVCGAVAKGKNPFSACKPGNAICDAPGACDGLGTCMLEQEAGYSCSKEIVCTAGRVFAEVCDGLGACLPTKLIGVCKPAKTCDGADCGPNTCTDDAGCITGFSCVGGRCLGNPAASCDADEICISGHCAFGGLCCDQVCNYACETCSGKTPGTCEPLPKTSKYDTCSSLACACQNQECNGVDRVPKYVGAETTCGTDATCNAHGTQLVGRRGTCDGAGTCVETSDVVTDCFPYRCDPGATACNTSCLGKFCAPGATCNVGHVCVAGASPAVASPDAASSGCGCRTAGEAAVSGRTVAMLGILAVALAARRRRRRGQPTASISDSSSVPERMTSR